LLLLVCIAYCLSFVHSIGHSVIDPDVWRRRDARRRRRHGRHSARHLRVFVPAITGAKKGEGNTVATAKTAAATGAAHFAARAERVEMCVCVRQ